MRLTRLRPLSRSLKREKEMQAKKERDTPRI